MTARLRLACPLVSCWLLLIAGCGGTTQSTGEVGAASGGASGGGGSSGEAAANDAGQAGAASATNTGGKANGVAGSGASTAGATSGSATGGVKGEEFCDAGRSRCRAAGRETCLGGLWLPAACPLDTPSCEKDSCVVRGPKLVEVLDFYIDSTEVTVAQYEDFVLAEQMAPSEQGPQCEWNDSVVPANWVDKQAGNTSLPVTEIDWCDAAAYCKWANKRLCGHRDRQAQLVEEDLLAPGLSQWSLACGGPTGTTHPSPNSSCNAGEEGALRSVASSSCEGSPPGVFDLEGNAAEWIDSCQKFLDMPRFDTCFALGGDANDLTATCHSVSEDYTRGASNALLGFRCCSG